MQVRALQSFEHGGSRKRGATFSVSDNQAKKLEQAGLVEIVRPGADPVKAGGARSSASPAAQASPQTTLRKSKRGGRRRKAGASSLPTQHSS